MKKKWLAIGIILLFVGTCIIPAIAQITKKQLVVVGNSPQKIIVIQGNHTITHSPGDGLYWNDCKLREYTAPLFLHYHFRFFAPFYPTFTFTVSSGIMKVEYYIDGGLIETIISPPWEILPYKVIVTPFYHSPTYGIKVYYNDGPLSDNVTIYRLFP